MGITILVDSNGDEVIFDEESTGGIDCAFEDEEDADVVPGSIAWTLTDLSGTVINSREQVAVAVPAASVTITLSGDDLALQSAEANREKVKRRFLVEAVYDSDLGDNLPLKASCEFSIRNLRYVS